MAHMGWELENMVPAPAATATARALITTEDGIILAYGNTMPVDATSGYGIGCIFIHADGGDATALYVNEGTATSCDFNAITVA